MGIVTREHEIFTGGLVFADKANDQTTTTSLIEHGNHCMEPQFRLPYLCRDGQDENQS
ncbi:MAG TPA: hypothetical protein VML01_10660 [Bryobacterales bacterium]|nr:hypothetical protein [Bryobacterales bacterium]